MKKLFDKNEITPSCSYCVHGRFAPDKESVLCIKKGVVSLDYACKKFKYDPLKRKPVRPKNIEKFDESDFALADFSASFEEDNEIEEYSNT